MKYYRCIPKSRNRNSFSPKGKYERINADGSIETTTIFGYNSGCRRSCVKEVCFSKSIAGSVLAAARGFSVIRKAEFHIYETEEKPDVDISRSLVFDFAMLEEVRYRRKIKAKRIGKITVQSGVGWEIHTCYKNWSEVDAARLQIVKSHIAKQIQNGNIIEKGRFFTRIQILVSSFSQSEFGFSVFVFKKIYNKSPLLLANLLLISLVYFSVNYILLLMLYAICTAAWFTYRGIRSEAFDAKH